MPNNVLFPFGNTNIDFAPAGTTIGWVPIANHNNLSTMADSIVANGNDTADHAIPSPIAHIKHFKKRLDNKDQDAINEWRGMLAVIALQDLKSLNITIKEIPIFQNPGTGAPTVLGSIICDALTDNSKITGYEKAPDANGVLVPNLNTLSVFCKDGIPFAMIMPGMVICPFKEYPQNLFSGIEWYDDRNGNWLSVSTRITDGPNLSVTEIKLCYWINGILSNHNNQQLRDFVGDILGNNALPNNNNGQFTPAAKNYGCGNEVWSDLRNVCPLPVGAPKSVYSDKLFIIVPPQGHNSAGIEKYLAFTPKVKTDKQDPYYIVPPIHPDVVTCLREGHATLQDWDITPDIVNNEYIFNFTLKFPNDGAVMSYTKKYTYSDVVWTDDMPYISLWPDVFFGDDSWKEYFVSVWNNEDVGTRNLANYGNFVGDQRCQRVVGTMRDGVQSPVLEIKLVSKTRNNELVEYTCHSEFKNKDFKMLSSTSQPYALEFSYRSATSTYLLGSWIFDRTNDAVAKVDVGAANKTYYIGMDFGTTSTNVYMREDNPNNPFTNLGSISSAGKYLYEIFNPYNANNNGQQTKTLSDFIQNYYLFSGRKDSLGKIFTYGQNFTSEKNGIAHGSVVSNVSGRAVVVDEQFIIQNSGQDSGIYNGLKMRRKDKSMNVALVNATNNFISNILTYAVLEAKAKGASTINLRVSYPATNFANTVLNSINSIVNDLSSKSGITINLGGATEARAAGEYFAKYVGGVNAPIPQHGYVIIDIGGGTTDVSFWKKNPNDTDVNQKDEHSFGYAGNFLVTKTIIQAVRSHNDFTNMWAVAPNSPMANAIDNYNKASVPHPIENTLRAPYPQKSSALDFLLEKCDINYGMLNQAPYKDLLSAIRLKYYSLFYLIANYLKSKIDDGIIELSPISFRMCLAGCGSKGMSFCRQDTAGGSFDDNLKMLFNSILQLPQNCAFTISHPSCDNKEEVVIGLTIIPNAQQILNLAGTGTAPQPTWASRGAAASSVTVAEEATAEETVISPKPVLSDEEELDMQKNAYCRLLDMLSYFEGSQNDQSHILNKIDPRKNANANNYFILARGNVDIELEHANIDAKTYEESFALFMLESMINNFI